MEIHKNLTESEYNLLLEALQLDILDRYNNEEYWDESIIEEFYSESSSLIDGYCPDCYGEIADRLYIDGSVVENYCIKCNVPVTEVLETIPEHELEAQKADFNVDFYGFDD